MQKVDDAPVFLIGTLFFASGVSALTYQVAWQRILFVSLGVDLESVTIIVASFMLGLGCGALLGGQLADRFPTRTLTMFALAEIGIGAFGFASPTILGAVGDLGLFLDTFERAALNFGLIAAPTTLMGATLPILIVYLTRRWRNVGRSTGALYAANTLGAACGAVATGFVLFQQLSLNQSIFLAACINGLVAVSMVVLLLRRGKEMG